MTYSSEYDSVRATVDSKGSDSRVEVNQRALIDKILARYASAGAVYRELIQNSNDAEATQAEIHITTSHTNTTTTTSGESSSTTTHPPTTTTTKEVVTQVVYQNNGMPFRTQDWARLKKIAEGNPDVSKVGAFGVGAYTMFSICEEPLVISGKEALAFVWKGDSLYTRVAPNKRDDPTWTTFVLPSRDPYPVPDLTEFGKFLCASLTFTQCLQSIQVTVNGQSRLSIQKSVVQQPTIVQPPQKSSFWSNDGAITASPQGLFKFQSGGGGIGKTKTATTNKSCIMESIHQFHVQLDQDTSTIQARYVSGIAKTKIPTDMAKRMERVTKKQPPPTVHVQLFLNAQHEDDDEEEEQSSSSIVKRGRRSARKKSHHTNAAKQITSALSPQMGTGRIFIGFRTSQTTGLAAHVAAPLLPTVEREAIDFQDPTLRIYNIELLELVGILMRLTLEHSMTQLGQQWEQGYAQRQLQEQQLLLANQQQESTTTTSQKTTSRESSTMSEDNGENMNGNEDEDDEDDDASTVSSSSSSTSFIGFARFMAKGVKKKIVSSLKTVSEAITLDDGSAELFNPRDPLPLSHEERLAIVLMRSFCPQQSTPDTLVGTILAQGFSRALAQSPPVLTKGGLRRGQHAKLPHYGMEVFVDQTDVVRSIVLENAREYHEVIARCRPLAMEDVTKALGASHTVLEETKVIRFLKWWCKYYRVDSSIGYYASSLRNAIRFFPSQETLRTLQTKQGTMTHPSLPTTATNGNGDVTPILRLRDIIYYVDESKFPSEDTAGHTQILPMPDSVLPPHMQQRIGGSSIRTFYDEPLRYFFESLSMEVWADFVSHHRCMTAGQPEDEVQRNLVLTTLHKEYHKRPLTERVMFASYLQNLLSTKRCIPFDSQEPTQYAADYPADLYLYSAELKAFDGVSGATGFNKVSLSLKDKGVSDEFLVSLGVRKSVAIDFLFQNLDTLSWSSDPKPLVEYLRTAVLTNEDLAKLKGTQYLPAENDVSRTFAPSELYLPSAELRLFPFVTLLQWPSEDDLVHSPNGKFLQKLGCKQHPPLSEVLKYIASDALDGELRRQGLDYVCKNLGPKGVYEREYAPPPMMRGRSSAASLQSIKFLPCVRTDPLVPNSTIRELRGPNACFSNPHCRVMGFPCLDPELDKKSGKLYSSRFRCPEEPDTTSLVQQLLELVEKSKKIIQQSKVVDKPRVCTNVSTLFEDIFKYLSSRTDFDARTMKALQSHNFIPCKSKSSSNDSSGLIDWYRPTDVYFKSKNEKDEDSITEILFHVIEFSPFLAAAGVKSEATTHDLFQLTVLYPEKVLRALGSEEKYRALLRRIAANPPFKSVPPAISKAPFLLAYKIVDDDDDESNKGGIRKTQLAAAEDIYIVDNSFFGRMFPVLQAPHESDLEDFYCRLGSKYISKGVKKNFEVLGGYKEGTPLALQLAERLNERRPLLVSPSVTSRPLLSNASAVLDEKNVVIAQANDLKAVYSLGSSVRNQRITCCAKAAKGRRNVLFVTKDFDWFDVGYAIGALILQRCQLEDAFFIGSLLEAPLDQLRARGFPVDRILRPVEPVILHEEPPAPPQAPPQNAPKAPTPAPESPTVPKVGQKPKENDENGFQQILQQMFPDCSPDYIQALLGPDADLEKLQKIADELASGNYPKSTGSEGNQTDKELEKDELTKNPVQKSDKKSSKEGETKNKQKFGKRLSRALSGRKGNNSPDKKPPAINPLGGMNSGAVGDQQLPPRMETVQGQPSMNGHNDGQPKAPEDDAADNSRMESLLEQTIGQSNKVNPRGINSAETHLTHLPHSHERPDNGCEVIPSQHIKPFSGPYRTGKTKKGVRIFFSRQHPESEDFLNEHFHAVETFADVLEALCDIYSLPMMSVCIFHDPSGSTIAFNSNRSLHFNVRFFYSLHYAQNRQNSSDCYSYWFTTMAHELAHHLAAGHNKEHGFYTESYITKYLPKFATMLAKLDD